MKIKKRAFIRIVFICLFITLSSFIIPETTVSANGVLNNNPEDVSTEFNDIIKSLLSSLNLEGLEDFFNSFGDFFSDNGEFYEMLQNALNGTYLFDFSFIYSAIFKFFTINIKSWLPLFLSVFAVAIISGILEKIGPKNLRVSETVFAFSYGATALIILSQILTVFTTVKQTLNNITVGVESIFPILLTLVAICGGTSSSKVFSPVCVFVTNGVMQIAVKVLFPIIITILLINVVSGINEKFSLKNFKNFFNDAFKWIVGITLSVFTFFVTVNGFGSSVFDGVTLRALKYAVGSSVPIIGNFAKEGLDMVILSGLLIKNAVGVVALTLIFGALLSPILSVTIFSLGLKLLSGLLEPVTDKRICDLVSGFSKAVSLIGVVLIMVFVTYFITIFMIICAQSAVFS